MKRKLMFIAGGMFVLSILFAGRIYKNMDSILARIEMEKNMISQNAAIMDNEKDVDKYSYNNVYVTKIENGILYGYTSDSEHINISLGSNQDEKICDTPVIADIDIENNHITSISLKRCVVKDNTARLVTDEYGKAIESELYGRLNVTDNFVVYKNSYTETGNTDKNENMTDTTIVFENEDVCALIITEGNVTDETINTSTDVDNTANNSDNGKSDDNLDKTINTTENADIISVVIMNNSFSDIYHKNFSVEGYNDEIITVYEIDEKKQSKEKIIARGNKISIKYDDSKACFILNTDGNNKRISDISKLRIKCPNENGLVINSMKRCSPKTPYRGSFIINLGTSDMVVVNELDIEDYLKGVVCSEMPESFHEEALKAQAVCARTYTAKILKNGNSKYKKYNAHMDDSTSYQVYNNSIHNDKVNKAIEETKGEILTYDDNIATVFYYSTSCGYSAALEDVFSEKLPYFTASIQTNDDWQTLSVMNISNGDLHLNSIKSCEMEFSENQFRTFLGIRNDYLESESPWFSWQVDISEDNMIKMINNSGYGNVSNIKEIKTVRSKGGIVTKIEINTTDKTISISGQHNIRKVLAPVYDNLLKADGTSVSGMKLLPSAFLYIERENNRFKIVGGGYGHGAGLSQYGADALGKKGNDYKEILNHYFNGTKVTTF